MQLSFDIANLARSGTNHEDQPSARIKPEFKDTPHNISFPEYAGPEQRFCPARVSSTQTEVSLMMVNLNS